MDVDEDGRGQRLLYVQEVPGVERVLQEQRPGRVLGSGDRAAEALESIQVLGAQPGTWPLGLERVGVLLGNVGRDLDRIELTIPKATSFELAAQLLAGLRLLAPGVQRQQPMAVEDVIRRGDVEEGGVRQQLVQDRGAGAMMPHDEHGAELAVHRYGAACRSSGSLSDQSGAAS